VTALRLAVVAEYYPRPSDQALGIWAHRQAAGVHAQGADVQVLALERPLPPLRAVKRLDHRLLGEWIDRIRHPPADASFDGVPIRYVRFVSPPRPLSYATWGRWAARPLARALDRLWADAPLELVHAHYAVPAGDAVLRWFAERGRHLPLVVSVHGGDLSYTAARSVRGHATVARVLEAADAVIANSEVTRRGIEALTGPLPRIRVIHPGADTATSARARHADPTLVTVANLEPHKNQASVIRALAALAGRHPRLRYELIGKGPDRDGLEALARSLGVTDRVTFRGALPHEAALAELARCQVHVMPSTHDAFGVAHVEAMAAGVPTIGAEGTGAEDIAAAGEGIVLVPAGDIGAIARAIERLVSDPAELARVAAAAHRTAGEHFSWSRNAEATLALYREVLESAGSAAVNPSRRASGSKVEP
jgi:teichuronic acid biosynthesis glycosyltransferase TuaC